MVSIDHCVRAKWVTKWAGERTEWARKISLQFWSQRLNSPEKRSLPKQQFIDDIFGQAILLLFVAFHVWREQTTSNREHRFDRTLIGFIDSKTNNKEHNVAMFQSELKTIFSSFFLRNWTKTFWIFDFLEKTRRGRRNNCKYCTISEKKDGKDRKPKVWERESVKEIREE